MKLTRAQIETIERLSALGEEMEGNYYTGQTRLPYHLQQEPGKTDVFFETQSGLIVGRIDVSGRVYGGTEPE